MAKQSNAKSKTASSTKHQSKTKNTKTSLDKPKNPQNPPKVLVILGVVVLVLLGFWGYKQVLIYQEKQQFEKARKSIELTTNGIMKETEGAQQQKTMLDSCEYGSSKFTKGPLGCRVGTEIIYYSVSDTDANKIIQNSQRFLEQRYSAQIKDIILPFDETDNDYTENTQSINIPGTDLMCHAFYSRLNPELTPKGIEEVTTNLYIRISCYSPAKAEHYPLNN